MSEAVIEAPAEVVATTAAPAPASVLGSAVVEKPLAERVPEKFRVAKEDGAFDHEGTLGKVLESYTTLEKRMAAGDAPPKTVEEYKLDGLPETVKLDDLKADPKMQSFLKGAHAKGLTSAQVSYVVNEYLARASTSDDGVDASAAAAENLRTAWSDKFDANVKHAHRAVSAYAQAAGLTMADVEAAGLGNNATFLRIMAAIGPELKEDSPPSMQSIDTGNSDIAADRRTLAGMDAKDPAYPALRAKVDQWYAKTVGTAPVR